jgi:IS30 family transposase
MSYQQLTLDQRYQIYAFKKAGFNQTQMAQELDVHKSTISRELRRNRGERTYRPQQAQEKAATRCCARQNATRISPQTWQTVETLILKDWSPEQIHGRLKVQGQATVSHEWIYQHLYQNQRAGGDLYLHLRCQKQRRKRDGRHDRRGQIPNRRSIDERPKIVATKRRLGDWEADTIIGARHQQAIVSLVERNEQFTLLRKVTRKTAPEVKAATCHLLRPPAEKVETITSDNGTEFALHEQIAAS